MIKVIQRPVKMIFLKIKNNDNGGKVLLGNLHKDNVHI